MPSLSLVLDVTHHETQAYTMLGTVCQQRAGPVSTLLGVDLDTEVDLASLNGTLAAITGVVSVGCAFVHLGEQFVFAAHELFSFVTSGGTDQTLVAASQRPS